MELFVRMKYSQYHMVEIEAYEKSFLSLDAFQWASFYMYLTVSASIRSLQDDFIYFSKCSMNSRHTQTQRSHQTESQKILLHSFSPVHVSLNSHFVCMRAQSCCECQHFCLQIYIYRCCQLLSCRKFLCDKKLNLCIKL